MRVIVVEDEPLSRRRLDASLRVLGLSPILASSGEEALRVFGSSNEPTLLLVDWVMPGMDGLALCRRLRSAAGGPIYAILLTVRTREEHVAHALDAGADDFLGKPYTTEALRARVQLGLRVLQSPAAVGVAFEEALYEGARSEGGVVIVRAGRTVGRVFLAAGRVAWAHTSARSISVNDLVDADAPLPRDEREAIVVEAARRKTSFVDVIIDTKLASEEGVHGRLRALLRHLLREIASLPGATALFVPETWAFDPRRSFAIDEVYDGGRTADEAVNVLTRSLRGAPVADEDELLMALDGDAVDGVLSLGLVDGSSATVLAKHGGSPEPNVLRALLAVVKVAEGTGPEEVSLTDAKGFHLLLRIPGRRDRFLYGLLDREQTLFAQGRLQMGRLAASL